MKLKTVVITGSARGLGFEIAKCFRKKDFNVVISDLDKSCIDKSLKELKQIKGKGNVAGYVANITNDDDIINLIHNTQKEFNTIDFWINNAGVNQEDKMVWELDNDNIRKMVEIDLIGTMVASKHIMNEMIKQNKGSIYTVMGHGSNDAIIPGLSIYGTAKRGLSYFVSALAKEAEANNHDIIIGKLSPGIMITDFLVNAYCDKKINLSEKNKKIYNILGDYPDKVAKYLVDKMIINTNNNKEINWLTKRKAMWKFMSFPFKKEKKLK